TDVNYDTWKDNLSELYFRTKNYDAALKLAEEVFAVRKEMYKENDPMLLASYGRLSEIYEAKGDIEKAYTYLKKDMDARVSKIQSDFSIMNQNEKEQYLSTFRYRFDEFNFFAFQHAATIPAIAQDVMNYQLANKSMLLYSVSAARTTFANNSDKALKQLYQTWLEKKQFINKLETLSEEELNNNNYNINTLQEETENIEKELFLKTGNNLNTSNTISWNTIKSKLQPGEAVIEFITIPDYDDTCANYNKYAAVLLKYNTAPEFIILCREDSLLYYMQKKTNEKDQQYISRIYGYAEFEEDALMYSGQNIYKLIWQPLESKLNDIKKIFVTQSGLLHKINFSAIPVSPVKCLADNYQIIHIASSKIIADGVSNVTLNAKDTIVLFGGIDYNATDEKLFAVSKKITTDLTTISPVEFSSVDTTAVRGGSWKYLPGTLQEINTIASAMKENKITVLSYTGENASEDIFKNKASTYDVLHIATHGFFVNDLPSTVVKNKSASTDYTLYNSGILLAGGNRSWQGETIKNNLQDGILTAAEVNNMDLSNCKLVVLSACETGLGTIQNDEGVFGLQRAFKLAGAENIIMSLWQVSDKETALFMQTLYKNWSSGISLQEAFIKTQNTLRIQYGPYYWAAFVLVE
ncbi:MAG: CHAT domain-containing protein, partial [Fimbriimonadaceae bacterium]|nr:CHAT domain-containing protein [Chitinophagales bacterium]